MVFGGLSCFLVVFLGFYSGFELLTTKTTVKTKKNHENSILRDNLKMVVFCFFTVVFTVVLVVCRGFWWFVVNFTIGLVVSTSSTAKRITINFWFSELVLQSCSCFVASCKIFVVKA